MPVLGLFGLVLLLLPPAAAAEPIHITGRLLDPTHGSGLSDATVELFPAWEKAAPVPLATARTDAQGFFEIAAPESGLFRLMAKGEGFLPMEHPLALVEDTEIETAAMEQASRLEVRTVDREGRPLAGVEVRISAQDGLGWVALDDPRGWRVADRRGVSGPDGRVVLPRKENEALTLTATTASFLGQSWVGDEEGSVTLRLIPRTVRTVRIEARNAEGRPPQRIAGKVIDAATKKPVAGAWVWNGWPLVAPGARTNAEGVFQLAVPPGVEVGLESAAAGYLPGDHQYVKQGANGSVVLSLRPAATLAGRVVDGAGQPLAGAKVETVFSRKGRSESVLARSRGDGSFRLTGLLPSGVYELTATHQGFARKEVSVRTAPPGQASAPVRIVMTDGQTAFGRVVDEGGRPVSGAEVRLMSLDARNASSVESWQLAMATADAEGRFEFRHLRPGAVQVSAKHRGYAPGELPEVKLPPGQPRFDLGDLKLPAGAAIEGRVTDTREVPIAGARVWISPNEEQSGFGTLNVSSHPLRLQEVETGPDGRFRIADLQRGQAFVVGASHPGYVDAFVAGVPVPNEEPVRIEMRMAHGLRGQVVGPAGEPVAGASLSRALGLETFLAPDGSDPFRPLGMTDSEGRFAVTGLAAGPLNLQIRADGYQPRKIEGLEIPEDGDLTDLKIALERGAWLAVRVLDGDDEPVPGMPVMAMPDEKTLARYNDPFASLNPAQTDAEGRCRVSLLGPGIYNVSVLAMRGEASRQVEAGLGETPVELRFPSGTEVSGKVLDAEGSVVPGATLQLRDGEKDSFLAQSDADGTFAFRHVADGRYVLKARGEERTGRSSNPLDVEVAGQPVRNLEVRLDRENPAGAVLTGRLLGLAPGELKQVFVIARSEQSNFQMGKVDPEGSYRIEDLSPGVWTVEARLPLAGRLAQGTIEIDPAAAGASLDLEFSAGFLLRGRVLVDGSPLAGGLVIAESRPAGGYNQMARTAPDGSFTLGDVPAGTLMVGFLSSDGTADARLVQVSADQEITIESFTGRLSGRIVTAAGDPVEDAAIAILGGSAEARAALEAEQDASPLALRSSPDGIFAVVRITAGTYSITVEKEGFAPAQVTVDVPPGGERTVEIRLKSQ
jgi:protocatechuate 3,4-dioxygenase beta subunit